MQADAKCALREQMLSRRALRLEADQLRVEQGIFARVRTLSAFDSCKVIFLYCSTKKEISTHEIMELAFASGKTVCVPLCGAHGEMTARKIASMDALRPGRFGILEPDASAPVVPPEEVELVLAPCLCADRAGYRLGYGGGYYDRFLARAPRAAVCALCAADSIVPTVFPEPHDIRCDQIITEREVLTPDEE